MRVTSVIPKYEQRLSSKSYVCSTTFGRATLGANGVFNKLFLAFLFSYPDICIQFLKNVALIRSSMLCCKCGSQMSWCVHTNRKDGCWWRCRRFTSASECSASTSIRHGSRFQQRTSWRFCSSRKTLYAHTNTIKSTWWHEKAFLSPYNRMGDYIYQLAHYMFAAGCQSDNVHQFISSSASFAIIKGNHAYSIGRVMILTWKYIIRIIAKHYLKLLY
jgi:hypothetical protein